MRGGVLIGRPVGITRPRPRWGVGIAVVEPFVPLAFVDTRSGLVPHRGVPEMKREGTARGCQICDGSPRRIEMKNELSDRFGAAMRRDLQCEGGGFGREELTGTELVFGVSRRHRRSGQAPVSSAPRSLLGQAGGPEWTSARRYLRAGSNNILLHGPRWAHSATAPCKEFFVQVLTLRNPSYIFSLGRFFAGQSARPHLTKMRAIGT